MEESKRDTDVDGFKLDMGKLRFDLVPPEAIKEIAKVMTKGCEKYPPNNWKKVDDLKNRYLAALYRHLNAWQLGENNDPDTGISHLSHALTNMCFLVWDEQDNLCERGEER